MARRRQKAEPTIALINVVFLMLVFFMVAGSIAIQPAEGVSLVRTAELEGRSPQDALVIRADGTLEHAGEPVADAAAWAGDLEDGATARILPDRDLAAETLVRVAGILRGAGADRVVMITQRGLE